MIPGLDVGSPQGTITAAHWAAVAQTHSWAFLRCLQGTGPTVDGTFAGNLLGARAAGLPVGAYFVFIPGDDPEAQASAWFAASAGLGRHPGELPPAIDFEVASKTLSPEAELAALCATVRAVASRWGCLPLVYSYPDFEKRAILAVATPDERALLAACPLWFAAYASTAPAPPAPWTRVTFWQSSGGDRYHLPSGAPCDADFFVGDADALRALALFNADAPGPNPLAGIPVPGLVIPGENA